MSKDKWNLLVNILLYLVGCGIVSTGCLLYFVLLPGSRGGHGLALLGLSRHEWGDIHFYLAIAITTLTVLHLVLNWSWIVVTVRHYLPGRDKGMGTAGAAVLILFLLIGVGLLVAPFALTVERGAEGESHGGQVGHGNRGGKGGQADRVELREPGAEASPQAAKEVHTNTGSNVDPGQGGGAAGGGRHGAGAASADGFFLRGRTTLQEAANAVGIPLDRMARELGLPENTPADARFSNLCQEQGLEMSNVRALVERLRGRKTE